MRVEAAKMATEIVNVHLPSTTIQAMWVAWYKAVLRVLSGEVPEAAFGIPTAENPAVNTAR